MHYPSYPHIKPKLIPQIPTDSYTGFIRGNLFANLYKPYTNLEPFDLRPNNEKEALLNKIREYDFARSELRLFLDNFPEDTDKIKLYNDYSKLYNQYVREYEKRYAPISVESETLNSYPWKWLASPWPWEVD